MTHQEYRERLDAILTRLENQVAIDVTRRVLAHKSGQSPKGSHLEAKQALTSLIKELVAEAKPRHLSDISGYHEDFTPEQLARITAANRVSNEAVKKFEQNLLKALEEV